MFLAPLLAYGALLAGAAAPEPLTPQGAWVAKHIGGHCAVTRSYGDGRPVLVLRQRLAGDRVDIALLGADEPFSSEVGLLPSVATLPGGQSLKGELFLIPMSGGKPMLEVRTRENPLPDLAGVAGLSVTIGRRAPIAFALDQQAAAQALLASCHDALVRSWGIDPAGFSPLGASSGHFYGAAAYPAAAAARREEGPVSVLVEIPPSGRGGACRVVESSGSASLDAATCDIARNKVTFTPARDDAGKPRTVWTVMKMNWRLPG